MFRQYHWVILSLFFNSDAIAQQASTGVVLTTTSELLYNGISESLGKSILGVNLDQSLGEQWYWGLEAHDVIESVDTQQRERSVGAYLGWQQEIRPETVLGFAINHREFPGSTKEWDFTELQTSISLVDRAVLILAYSPDYYEHDTHSLAVTAAWFQPFSRQLYSSVDLGVVTLSSADLDEYVFAEFAIGWRQRQTTLELKYNRVSHEGEILFGTPIRSAEWHFSATYLLW